MALDPPVEARGFIQSTLRYFGPQVKNPTLSEYHPRYTELGVWACDVNDTLNY